MLWTSGKLENMPSSVQNVNHSSVYLLCTKKARQVVNTPTAYCREAEKGIGRADVGIWW